MLRGIKTVILFGLLVSTGALGCETPASVCFRHNSGFPLIENGQPLPVVVSAEANPAVKRVASAFAEDLQRTSGSATEVLHTLDRRKKPL